MHHAAVPTLLDVRTFAEAKGELSVVDASVDLPFKIERVYYLHHVPSEGLRGAHAHKELWQLMIPMAGEFKVLLDDGANPLEFELNDCRTGLLIPPGYWRDLSEFSTDGICVVLASLAYSEADYIRDYDEFVAWARERRGSAS